MSFPAGGGLRDAEQRGAARERCGGNAVALPLLYHKGEGLSDLPALNECVAACDRA